MRRLTVALVLLLLSPAIAFSQADPIPGEAVEVTDQRLQLAIADSEYPVTPGDVYELSFLQGAEQVTRQVVVESNYRLNLGIFGSVDAKGMSFSQLKPEVERIIANAYPRGLPSLNIATIGVFRVTLVGAIPRTTRIVAWGLSRLTEVVGGNIGPFTSLREVVVRSRDGTSAPYDLFRAIHTGDESQDRRLRPGDTVTFRRQGKTVTVEGEVYESGTYELLVGEGLSDLEGFFQGFRPRADTQRLVVERQTGDTVRQISIGSPEQASGFFFRDGDVLIVPERVVPRPVVYLEGAVDIAYEAEPQEDADSSVPIYNRVSVPLTAGDTLYSLLLNAQERISPFADIERGYVIRQDNPDPIRINMRQVLYRESEFTNLELQPFDRVVIPLDQPFVLVTGGVDRPRRYPYNPFESYPYYLGLAGIGSGTLGELADVVRILDREGNRIAPDAMILPGYTISVPEGTTGRQVVVVSGDVPAPGAYPFVPGEGTAFYVRRAGLGANALAAARDIIIIYDPEGAQLDADQEIQPEFTVHVPPLGDEPEIAYALVTGAVNSPGVYEIAQGSRASYYVMRAGGVNPDMSATGTYQIMDLNGDVRPEDAIVRPGDTIEVATDSFFYSFNRYFPVITTGLGFITTIIAIVNALNP